jgi:hypothetical protein
MSEPRTDEQPSAAFIGLSDDQIAELVLLLLIEEGIRQRLAPYRERSIESDKP